MSEFGDVNAKDLVPGTLRGYRAWTLDRYSNKLRSVSMAHTWSLDSHPPATCFSFHSLESFFGNAPGQPPWPHHCPQQGCSCGYYATYDLQNLYAFRSWHQMNQSSIAVGTVKAYGSVILGTIGFRAQYMEIEALVWSVPLVAEKAAAYGVPVVRSFEALVSKYPPSNVDELIGTPRELQA